MATSSHEKALDQLQTEVNRVLEQTGRVFAAANGAGRNIPNAQGNKLRKMLPDCNLRFHAALDQLEDELHMAKLAMRRDLALFREKAAHPNVAAVNGPTTAQAASEVQDQPEPEAQKVEPQESNENDIVMQDSEMMDTTEAATDPEPGKEEKEEPSVEATSASEAPATSTAQADATNTDSTGPGPDLHVETQPQTEESKTTAENATDQDKAPDTGTFSNVNDLDSLFGGPLSAGAGEAPDFNIDPNATSDFDFDAFGASLDSNAADNDNIASLLPGLEDYANTQSAGNGMTDFDDLFSSNLPGEGEGGDPRDSTFDDLLDLPDFNVDEFTGGTGEAGSNENKDFDFSME